VNDRDHEPERTSRPAEDWQGEGVEEVRPNNPLGPYFPSDPPTISGNGRRWFAIFAAFLLLQGVIAAVLALLL
jgi:hypothetical protein